MRNTFIFFMSLVSTLSAFATERAPERQITVTGICFREITPDRGAVIATVEILDSDLKRSTERATQIHEKLRARVQKLSLKDSELKSVEYSVFEQREWEKNKSVSKGFKTRIGLRVSTSEIARLGEVTEIASQLEIREVGGLSTFLSQNLSETEKINCLKDAALNAHTKAEKLASSLGASLGPVLMIQEGDSPSVPRPIPLQARAMLMSAENADRAAPTIEAGKQQLSEQITVSFALK